VGWWPNCKAINQIQRCTLRMTDGGVLVCSLAWGAVLGAGRAGGCRQFSSRESLEFTSRN
jgi:hypothetical protein